MKKTQDEKRNPTKKSTTTHPKGIPTIPKDIWEKALERTRGKEAKNAGPPMLGPMND
tara:strand:+ start:686 stop:856 length:171 start_codon:yes stop_codon:yes gene_type:complete